MLTAEDRITIHELISLHGHIADDRTPGRLGELLTEDAAYDLEAFGMGTVTGLPALMELFERAPGEQPVGHHVNSIVVSEQPDGTARVRSKGLAVMADGAARTATYEDHVVRTPAGWRIAHRTVLPHR